MQIAEQQMNDVLVITIAGRLDAATAPIVDERLRSMTGGSRQRFILDLSNVPYIATAGIRVLLGFSRDARRHSGDVRLAAVQPLVARTLELVGLAPVLNVYADVATALDSFA